MPGTRMEEGKRPDAYDFSDVLKQKLVNEGTVVPVSLEFKKLQTNAEKVRFNFELLKERNLLPPKSWMRNDKNENQSIQAKTKGNQYFSRNDFVNALEAYNESLCYATVNSETYATILANRAIIYLKAGFYGFALENINLALNNKNCPLRLKEKWEKRKQEIEEKMDKNEDTFDVYEKLKPKLELSHAPNPKMPCAIDALEYASDDVFGRYVRTKQNLKPGDIIILEKPFFKTLLKTGIYSQCTNCMKNNYFNLFPCEKTTSVMFCSTECATDAWERFYKYEYPIIDGIFDLFTKIQIITLRATIRTFTMVPNLEALKAFINSIDEEKENAFNIDYTTAKETDEFKAIYALATNEDSRTVADSFQRTNLCAIAWYIAKEFTDLRSTFKDEEIENLFLELLVRFNQAAAVNYHCVSENMQKSIGLDLNLSPYSPKTCGSGAFALCSLINHSCAPNVVRFSSSGINVILVVRPIRVGEQIFDNYGPHHCLEPRNERIKSLKDQYLFACNCEACKNDYKDISNLEQKVQVTDKLSHSIDKLRADRKYNDETRRLAAQSFTNIAKFLEENDKFYPCMNLSKMQEALFVCAHMLFFPRPLELILVPQNSIQ